MFTVLPNSLKRVAMWTEIVVTILVSSILLYYTTANVQFMVYAFKVFSQMTIPSTACAWKHMFHFQIFSATVKFKITEHN